METPTFLPNIVLCFSGCFDHFPNYFRQITSRYIRVCMATDHSLVLPDAFGAEQGRLSASKRAPWFWGGGELDLWLRMGIQQNPLWWYPCCSYSKSKLLQWEGVAGFLTSHGNSAKPYIHTVTLMLCLFQICGELTSVGEGRSFTLLKQRKLLRISTKMMRNRVFPFRGWGVLLLSITTMKIRTTRTSWFERLKNWEFLLLICDLGWGWFQNLSWRMAVILGGARTFRLAQEETMCIFCCCCFLRVSVQHFLRFFGLWI